MQFLSCGFQLGRRRRRSRAVALASAAIAAVALTGAPAGADLIDEAPLAPTWGFDVFTLGDATVVGNENEGSHAIGGNLAVAPGAVYNVGNAGRSRYSADGDPAPTALYVRGRALFPAGTIRVLGNQFARVLDVSNASVNQAGNITRVTSATPGVPGMVEIQTPQPATTVSAVPTNAIDFEAAFASLRQTASRLSTCASNVTPQTANGDPLVWPDRGTVTAYLRLEEGRTNVLELTAEQLRSLDGITFRNRVPDDATLLINVRGWTTGSWRVPNFAGIGREEARRILLNFGDATEIVLAAGSATVEGTIYAPSANVSLLTSSNVEGHIASAGLSHTGGGEIHDAPFESLLSCASPDPPCPPPGPTPDPTPDPTPEPTPGPTPTPTPTPEPTPDPTPTPVPTPESTPSTTPNCDQPSLTITKSASRSRVGAGDTVRYTLAVRNRRRAVAVNARICDRLPSRLSVVRTGGGTLSRGKRLCWRVARIARDRIVRRSFVARVDRDAPRGARIRNVATVDTSQVPGTDARAQRTVRVVRAVVRRRVTPVTG